MTLVRIAPSWEDHGLLRQTPGARGRWADIEFTQEPVERCDYTLVINTPSRDVRVYCSPDRVWGLVMEPPNEVYRSLHVGHSACARLYTTDPDLSGPRYFHTQPGLGWSVERSYDDLLRQAPPEKDRALSWVTSSKGATAGHRKRLEFLERIRSEVSFDLYGRGFRPISDKWDGLAPYRYSLALENFRNPYYWSEKLSDCFMAWSMPIYYGCTRITEYFPAEAMVVIDIDDPSAPDTIREAMNSDRWRRNRDAIAHARSLVLEKYQFFPMMVGEITQYEAESPTMPREPQWVYVPGRKRLRWESGGARVRRWVVDRSRRLSRPQG